MRTLNLRIWFPLLTALLFGLTLLLWSGLQYQRLIERTQQQQLELWRDNLARLQASVSRELLRGDVNEAQSLISQYAVDPDLQVLVVTDQHGRVLLANRYAWRGQPVRHLPGHEKIAYASVAPQGHFDIHLDDAGKYIHASLPITLPGDNSSLGNLREGRMYVLYDLMRIQRDVLDLLLADLSTVLPIILLGVVLVWFLFQIYVSRPLDALRDASVGLSEGHYKPINLKGSGELARLAQSFNQMARCISTGQQQLRDSEEALQKSQSMLRFVLDSIPVRVFWKDRNSVYLGCNRQFAKDAGLTSPEQIIGKTDDELGWCEQSDLYCSGDRQVMQSGEPKLNYEEPWTTADGAQRWLQASKIPLRDLEGTIFGILGVYEDITERKQVEEALRRSQKMEAIGQLSGGIAHDFNNQLGIVIGYLDFLNRYTANDKKPHRWVETATRATLRCTDLTRQLLAFSRRQTNETMRVDLNASLKELETMIVRSITPEVEVQYFLSDDLWGTEIDPGEFQDVILNLVINARDAMPNGGKLLIETSNRHLDTDYIAVNPGVESGDYAQLMVSDNGTGMDKETQERIFEPFFTTKPEGKGTGLGLSMVYGFAKRYGGNIKVYSEPGTGSTFRLYLPRAAAPASEVCDREVCTPELPVGNESILIVDDEPDLLQLAGQYLTKLGYHVRRAENAPQALLILAEDEGIDLLFSDVVMPGGMNGYELAQKATELRPGLKVLLTSGYTSKTIAHNGLARFSAHLLSKPYRRTDLAQQVRQVLDEDTES